MTRTTLLGITYDGLPMFGSLALYLVTLEQREGTEAARKSLDAHERLNGKPIDLADQFTSHPMSMATRMPKMLAMIEAIEPARHVMTERARTGRAA